MVVEGVLGWAARAAGPTTVATLLSFSVNSSSFGGIEVQPVRFQLPDASPAAASACAGIGADARPGVAWRPRPVVAAPQRGQQVQRRGVGAAVDGADAHQHLFGPVLGVFDEDVEVAVVVEDAGVEQFVLGLVAAAAAVLLRAAARRERPAAGTCTGTSCTRGWAGCRGRSSTPSRPRHGCPRGRSGRTAAPSGSGRRRSTASAQSTGAAASSLMPAMPSSPQR